MSVARQVGKNAVRTGKRALGVDMSLFLLERSQDVFERLRIAKRGKLTVEVQASSVMSRVQPFQEQSLPSLGLMLIQTSGNSSSVGLKPLRHRDNGFGRR